MNYASWVRFSLIMSAIYGVASRDGWLYGIMAGVWLGFSFWWLIDWRKHIEQQRRELEEARKAMGQVRELFQERINAMARADGRAPEDKPRIN